MKRILTAVFIGFILSGSLTSCLKEQKCNYNPCDLIAPQSEIQAIQTYLTNNSITATQHCSGVFYNIIDPGTGKTPEACGTISVSYIGSLTNGSVFDQSTGATFSLGGLITGWKNGIPLLKSGGRIHLYIPPSLAYGNQQVGTIPPNSILVFDITLIAVQ